MSLIVDVLKRVQKDAVGTKPLPPFIKYPYKEGFCLRTIISRHVWLFRGAMGCGVVMILIVLMMILRGGGESTPKAHVQKPVTRSQEFSVALPEAHNPQDKSTPGHKKETKIVEPEKKVTAPSPKDKKMKSEDSHGKLFVEKRPLHDVREHFYLALSHQKQGETGKAIEGYGKIIEMDPMNVEAHTNLGVIYKDMGKLDQAVKEFQMVLSMNPRQENAHNNLGLIFYLRGNSKKAIQEFREVLDINPRNKEAYINLGVIYRRRNLTGKAKRMFDNALSIDSNSPEAHYNLGLISEERGDIKEAISCYQKFIDLSGSTYPELAAKVKSHLEMLSQSQK